MQTNTLITTVDSLKSLGQLDALKSLRTSIKQSLDYIDDAISSLGEQLPVPNISDRTADHGKTKEKPNTFLYNESWTYTQKYQYVLKKSNRFLHFREAARIVIDLEGKGDEDHLTSRLGNSARDLKKDGKIVSIQHGNSKKYTFWGSPKWLDENGKIIAGHEYDISILSKSARVSPSNSLFDI